MRDFFLMCITVILSCISFELGKIVELLGERL